MTTVINLNEIQSIVKEIDIISAMEKAFIEYSNGNSVVPPVGELLFNNPVGEAHIKYGYIKNDDYYVIKIASGFYDNPKLGIPSSQGIMLLFNQKTGQAEGILLDEGYLTNIRTAGAGALAAKYFAPKMINAIGIIGTGIQGKLQLQYLKNITNCKTVWIWDINKNNSEIYKNELKADYNINIASSISQLASNCNLIVTTTPSHNALLNANDVQQGTHLTAVGSDTSEKQELESSLLSKADLVISDSIEQSKTRGEVFRAVNDGAISRNNVIELGRAIQDKNYQRKSDEQITIVDLTGVAVQDIMIAKEVYNNYKRRIK